MHIALKLEKKVLSLCNARNISNESGLLYLGSSFCFSGMSTGDVEYYALKQTDSCACPRGLGRYD